jgi:hypothetical protein
MEEVREEREDEGEEKKTKGLAKQVTDTASIDQIFFVKSFIDLAIEKC